MQTGLPTGVLLIALPVLVLACDKDDELTEGVNPGECIDGADNDADGMFDCADPDCYGAPDCQGNTLPTGIFGTGVGTGTTAGSPSTGTLSGTPTGSGTTSDILTVSVNWTDVDGGEPSDTNGDFRPDVNCSSDTVDITIRDPLGVTSWDFGMAESGVGGWTGEDCLNGYAGFNYCHGISATDTLVEVCRVIEIREGTSTLFDASKDPFLTYIIDDQGDCFVFGDSTSYYANLGCVEMM